MIVGKLFPHATLKGWFKMDVQFLCDVTLLWFSGMCFFSDIVWHRAIVEVNTCSETPIVFFEFACWVSFEAFPEYTGRISSKFQKFSSCLQLRHIYKHQTFQSKCYMSDDFSHETSLASIETDFLFTLRIYFEVILSSDVIGQWQWHDSSFFLV